MLCKKVNMSWLLILAGMLGLAPGLTYASGPGQGTAPAVAKPPFWTYQDFLDKKIPEAYTIRKGHPRLLITPENKPEILDKIKACPKLWERVIRDAASGKDVDQLLACGMIWQLGLVPGFQYTMTKEQYGRKGVEALLKQELATKVWGPNYAYIAVPCGYDWLFDLLTPEQKQQVVAKFSGELRRSREVKKLLPYQLDESNCLDGQAMTFGLAFHEDGVDDAAARDIVEGVFKQVWWAPDAYRLRGPLFLIRYLEGGGNTEGMMYFDCHHTMPAHFTAWKTATGQDYFARIGYYRNSPYWVVYSTLPTSDGKCDLAVPFTHFCGGENDYWIAEGQRNKRFMAAATGFLREVDPRGAAMAQWWLNKNLPGGISDVRESPLFGLLVGDPRVQAKPPAELNLPQTLVVRGLNHVFMRDGGFENLDATVVAFANNRFPYRARSQNDFAIIKNGAPLFLFRGYIPYHNYSEPEMVPHTSVVFYKGAEVARTPFMGDVRADLGTFQLDGRPGQYDYVRGECGKFFGFSRSTFGKQVKTFERTLVYFRTGPKAADRDYVVLLDRTETADPSVTPNAVFHTVFEPKMAAGWDQPDAGKPVHEGRWDADDAPCVTVTMNHAYRQKAGGKVVLNAHGRAFLKALYPKAVRMMRIGGPGHALDDVNGKVDNKNMGAFNKADPDDQINVGGYWRFHVAPRADATRHTFLYAIEATDSKIEKPETLELLEGENMLGAQAGPNIALFSKDGKQLSAGSVKAASAGSFRIVVGDLKPVTDYTLTAGDQTFTLQSTKDAGTVFVKDVKLNAGDLVRIAS